MTNASRSRNPFRPADGTVTRGAGALLSLLLVACASGPQVNAEAGDGHRRPQHPRRAPGCELAIFHTAVPGVVAWDDLGVAEISCHISEATAECLRRLRNEACVMGGDIIYNVPRQPLRPREQVLVYRGQVAHTRVGQEKKQEAEDLPPPASAAEAAGPVQPFPRASHPGETAAAPAESSVLVAPAAPTAAATPAAAPAAPAAPAPPGPARAPTVGAPAR